MKGLEIAESNEIKFKATRSAGPGGQNVNKVNTRVELRFSITQSALLTADEKSILMVKLKNKINQEGELIITSGQSRSQLKNKELVLERFNKLIQKALAPVIKRIPTKPPAGVKLKRLEDKQKKAEIKKLRTPPKI